MSARLTLPASSGHPNTIWNCNGKYDCWSNNRTVESKVQFYHISTDNQLYCQNCRGALFVKTVVQVKHKKNTKSMSNLILFILWVDKSILNCMVLLSRLDIIVWFSITIYIYIFMNCIFLHFYKVIILYMTKHCLARLIFISLMRYKLPNLCFDMWLQFLCNLQFTALMSGIVNIWIIVIVSSINEE